MVYGCGDREGKMLGDDWQPVLFLVDRLDEGIFVGETNQQLVAKPERGVVPPAQLYGKQAKVCPLRELLMEKT
jgi:hypothetical protein